MIQHSISAPLQSDKMNVDAADGVRTPAMEAGWWLKRERGQVGARVDDVVAATRIEPEYIRALESGQLDLLPERNQALDLIWAYADFLMLEPGPLCSHYGKLLNETEPKITTEVQQSEFKGTAMLSRFLTPRIAMGSMIGTSCAIMVAIGGLVWTIMPGSSDQESEIVAQIPQAVEPQVDDVVTGTIPSTDAGVSDSTETLEKLPVARKVSDIQVGENLYEQSDLTELIKRTVAESTEKQKSAEKITPPEKTVQKPPTAKIAAPLGQIYGKANKNSRILIQAEARVFVRIEDNGGTVIFNKILNAGDGFRIPDRKGLVLVTRDGGAIKYVLDGERSGVFGDPGEMLVGRSLDLDKLDAKS